MPNSSDLFDPLLSPPVTEEKPSACPHCGTKNFLDFSSCPGCDEISKEAAEFLKNPKRYNRSSKNPAAAITF